MLEWQKVSKKISNWGRWGAQDELGTLNLITPHVSHRPPPSSKRVRPSHFRSLSTRTAPKARTGYDATRYIS